LNKPASVRRKEKTLNVERESWHGKWGEVTDALFFSRAPWAQLTKRDFGRSFCEFAANTNGKQPDHV
jgi:hypothetical protein